MFVNMISVTGDKWNDDEEYDSYWESWLSLSLACPSEHRASATFTSSTVILT